MGNFSINHYALLKISSDHVDLRYVIDMAEIPTFQEMQANDMKSSAYLAREPAVLKRGLLLEMDGRPLPLRAVSKQIIFPPGAGGLPTSKMAFDYQADFDKTQTRGTVNLRYRDRNFPDRIGWKEVVANAGKGVILRRSSVPLHDESLELTNYPTDAIKSPPQVLEAAIQFVTTMAPPREIAVANPAIPPLSRTAPPKGSIAPNIQQTPRNAFTQLINQQQFGLWFLVMAALIAAGLGAFHALEPGHGKTMVAAYLVGSQGTAMHACVLGLIVTAAHTAGVYLLGGVVLYASRYVVPERLYPWLGAASGVTIAGLGVYLLSQRWRGKHIHHHHAHVDDHHHHGHEHSHGSHHHHHHGGHHHHHHEHAQGTVSKRQLLALGVTGGIVPCPAALVVLLSAVALHRVAFGLFLIVAFSIGLAAVLIAIGLLMVYARRFMSRMSGEGPLITRWLPIASALFIAILGCGITLRALATAGLLKLPI
jgi:ABC-type nickel/cobalt efflux system permease component RcnA